MRLRFPWQALLPLTLLACAKPASAPVPPPAGPASASRAPLSLTYLGVAGWQVEDGAHDLLMDPYFTRRPMGDDRAAPLVPDEAAIARYAPRRAEVILVGHSHCDHLLDVPTIAQRTGAVVMGSESTLNVARSAGIPADRLVLARPGGSFERTPFAIRVFPGLHSLTGQIDAPIPPGIPLPMPASAYTQGGTLDYVVRVEGRTILFIDTANFVDGALDGLRPDVAVIAVGLREKIPDYTCRLMRALGRPALVLPNHFDAHDVPLGTKEDAGGDPDDLAAFAREVRACAPDTKVVVPVWFAPIAI